MNISAAYGMDVAEGASVAAQNVEAGILNNNGELSAGTLTVASGWDNGTLNVDNLIVSESSSESRAVNNFELNSDKYSFESVNVGEGAVLTTAAGTGISTDTLTNDGTVDASSLEANTLTNSSKLNAEKVEAGTLNNSGELSAGMLTVANGSDNGTLKVDNLIISESSNESETANSFALNKTDYSFSNVSVGEGSVLKAMGAMEVSGTLTIAESASAEVASSISIDTLTNAGTVGAESVEAGTLNNSGELSAGTLTVANGSDNGTLKVDNLIISESGGESETANSFVLNKTDYSFSNVSVGEGAALTTAAGTSISTDALTNNGTVNANSINTGTLTNSGTMEAQSIMADMLANEGTIEASRLEAVTLTNSSKLSAGNVAVTALTNKGTVETTSIEAGTLNNSGELSAGTLTVANGSDNGSLKVDNLIISNSSNESETANSFALNKTDYSFSSVSVGEGSALKAASNISAKSITTGVNSSVEAGSITAANLWTNESSRITAAFIAADAFTAAKDSVIAADYILSEDKLELGAGARIIAKAEDSAIDAGTLTAEKGSEITVNDIYVENSLENAGTLTAKSLSVANGSDNGTLNVEHLEIHNSSDGNTNSFVLNNDKYSFEMVRIVGTGASLEAEGSSISANMIGIAEGSSFTADGVQQVQTIHLENNASLTGGTVTMVDNGVINSNGGSLTAGTVAVDGSLTINSKGGSLMAEKLNGNVLTINLQADKAEQVKIGELELAEDTSSDDAGLIVRVNALDGDGSISANQVVIDNYDGSVKIVGSSDITDSFEDLQGGMKSLADSLNISNGSGSLSQDVVIKSGEGGVVGEITGTVDKDGNVAIHEDINYDNLGISEMASIGLMTWRQENNDMNKRLGELRDSSGEHGVWVRMTRGESKYGAQNIKNQYNSYQLGYDEKLSVDKHWTVGAALTYTDANSSFSNGKGENKHKGLSVYGSRLNDDGSFIDLIARYARLEHDFEVHGGAGKGAYDTNGYSLSAEYGKRFTQTSGLWLEPQVELTYGRVSGADYISDKGVRVRQDGMDSLVGRLGFALGQNLVKGRGNIYLRASYLYDFEGETDVRFSNATQSRGFKQDLGGGWWEVGVGANINISEATHLYFDVEKTYGGNVATPWQWNAGLRWSF